MACLVALGLSPGRPGRPARALGEELRRFEAAVAVGPAARARGGALLGRLDGLAQQLGARVLGYGSRFTGTGEATAELDGTLWVPMDYHRAQARRGWELELTEQMARLCRRSGLEVQQQQKLLIDEVSHGVKCPGGGYRSCSAGRCILSCQKLMPLYSSHLIRAALRL